jgi:hypothetical protein
MSEVVYKCTYTSQVSPLPHTSQTADESAEQRVLALGQLSKKRKIWADGAVRIVSEASGVRMQLLDEAGGSVYRSRSFSQEALRALLSGDEYLLEA